MNEQTPKKQILRSKQKKNLDHKNHRVYSPMKKNVIDVKKKDEKRCTVHKYKLFL